MQKKNVVRKILEWEELPYVKDSVTLMEERKECGERMHTRTEKALNFKSRQLCLHTFSVLKKEGFHT